MKRAITLMTLLTAFGASGSAIRVSDAAVRSLSLEQMFSRADRVVVGRVSRVESRWAEWVGVGRVIVTRCTITVEEALGGRSGENRVNEIEVEVPGGSVGDLTLVVSDSPALIDGERAVFFLVAGDDGDIHRIYGLESGKLPLRGSRIVSNPGLVSGPCSTLDDVRRAAITAGSR
jgi:hypothetical protein